VPGPQDDLFDEASRAAFFGGAAWQVSPRCDRMAMALAGPPLCAPGGHDIVSDGIVPGSVQVPGNGQPLVLMAESQTTGGYPKIATVIGADLPRLAQSPPGTAIRFQPVTQAEAEDLWRAHRQALERRLAALVPVAPAVLHSAFLLSVNLIGGTWPAAAEADGP
jgi:allophanate hydrolase